MQIQQTIAARTARARIGTTVDVLVDGRSPDSDLVVTGRLEGQAPEIDAQVIFSECDPTSLVPGTFVQARVVGASRYDLIATPLPT